MNLVLVCGSRTWTAVKDIWDRLDRLIDEATEDPILLVGGCSGADQIAEAWARKNSIETHIVYAKWVGRYKPFDKSAGIKRNRRMLDMKPHLVIAFRSDGPSPGTDWMIKNAAGLCITIEVNHEAEE